MKQMNVNSKIKTKDSALGYSALRAHEKTKHPAMDTGSKVEKATRYSNFLEEK